MSQFGRYYEDFLPGETINHSLSKTITESDNNLFCLLTMNHHPIHLDKKYAKGNILVVGTLVLSLVVGLSVPDISGKAIANLGYDRVFHLNPVRIDDTISAYSTVLYKRISKSNPSNGIVRVKTTASNQKGEDVLSFERAILVPRK